MEQERERSMAIGADAPQPPEQEKKTGKKWFQSDIARSLHAVLLLAAVEQGCAGRLRMVRRDEGPVQQGIIVLDSERERQLIPPEAGPESMRQERERVLAALSEMGVEGLGRVADSPIDYDALGRDYGFPGGEITTADDAIHLFVPMTYLLGEEEPRVHEYLTSRIRTTYRHELLHNVALQLRHSSEERTSYRLGEIDTSDPLAVGTDLHEAATAFFTSALRREDDVLDGAYFDGQELFLLCAEGLRRDGVRDPVAFMARTYFNGGPAGWSSIVERSGWSLVNAGLIRDAHDLVVAIDRLPDPDILEQGSEAALEYRSERFERETEYDLDRLPTDAREIGERLRIFVSLPSSPH